jgi:hypothetical protein
MKRKYYVQKIERLYKGFASVRENIIVLCVNNGWDLVLEWEGNYMGVPLEKLKNPMLYQIHTSKFQSKYNKDQQYALYDFLFIKNKGIKI